MPLVAWLIMQPNEKHPTQYIYRQAATGILCAINHQQSLCQRAENSQFWPAAHAYMTVSCTPTSPFPCLPLQRHSITAFNPNAGAPILPRRETDMFSMVHPFSQLLIGLLGQSDCDKNL